MPPTLPLPASPPATNQPDRRFGDPYLRFQLTDGVEAVLAMQKVQEVHTLPAHRLTPMPNMPGCVLGLMNRRSHVIWVVDLAKVLDVASLGTNHQQYNLVIARSGDLVLALAVPAISGFFWMPAEAIRPLQGQLSATLETCLQGCAMYDQDILLVLNPEAILHSATLHASPYPTTSPTL
jgi:twitching motility protein PilI